MATDVSARATENWLYRLLEAHGAVSVIVADVDEYARFAALIGEPAAASALARLQELFESYVTRHEGTVRLEHLNRFVMALPGCTYDETIAHAERLVDAVREMRIDFGEGGRFLSITAVVTRLESSADRVRFTRLVRDLLIDGKSMGGNVVIRDRAL